MVKNELCDIKYIRLLNFYVLSSFAIILTRTGELVAMLLFVFWMSCYCKCPRALPHGAIGWSAVCRWGCY